MSEFSKDIHIQRFRSFEAPNLMWPQAHQCSSKIQAFIRTMLKFDVQMVQYTLIIMISQ
jgi:hypothetical protein